MALTGAASIAQSSNVIADGTLDQSSVGAQSTSVDSKGIWGRIEAMRHHGNAVTSSSLAHNNVDSWKMQIGLDHALHRGRTTYWSPDSQHIMPIPGPT